MLWVLREDDPIAYTRRAVIASLAILPALTTVSTAVPISLPALEIDLVDEAINLRASEIAAGHERSGVAEPGRLCVA